VNANELRERTRRFALDVVRLCLKLGHDDLGQLIRPQLLRAGTGVATNHRAASRGRSGKEFAARLGVVVEEADESEFWLDVLREFAYGPQPDVASLHQESVELRAIFSASRTTVLARLKNRRKDRPQAGQ
jgi:four helix bundle protein